MSHDVVFVVMIDERHDDPAPEIFSTPEQAIAYARHVAERYAHTPADIEEADVPGWLFSATWGVEGDAVWVVEKIVDEEATP